MYIIQYSSFCFHLKYPQNEYELPRTHPETSPLRDESKLTFPKTPPVWLQGTSVTADFLDFSIPVTDHHTGLKTGCGGFHGLILQIKYSTGWTQSLLVSYSISHRNVQFLTKANINRLWRPEIFLETLQHTVCNSGKRYVFTKYLRLNDQ